MNMQDIIISSKDAVLLNDLVRRADDLPDMEQAVEQLTLALEVARIMDSARMPNAVVTLDVLADYVEIPDGRLRTVMLVHPVGADASRGRISVLSPVGRALLGRKAGSLIEVALPSGKQQTIKVVGVRNGPGGGDA